METSVTGSAKLLTEQARDYDLALLTVEDASDLEHMRARVERVYSSGKGLAASAAGGGIEFVSAPNHWGQKPLLSGDRAFVFLRALPGGLHECAWRGHLWIETIEGEPYAIFQHPELWKDAGLPEELRRGARADPKRRGCTAFRFAAMEAYLLQLVSELRGAPGQS